MSQNIVYFSETILKTLLPWEVLVSTLAEMFHSGCQMPLRHHHQITVPNQEDATLLVMPAWIEGRYLGVKLVNVFPSNRKQRLPSISANYLLSCGKTGKILALMDGGELTARRTAAASVLAAKYLASKKARHHLMIGTGRLSANIVQAYATLLDLKEFRIWGINQEHCEQAAVKIGSMGITIRPVPVDALNEAVAEADIISCATLCHQPVLRGEFLQPGTHVDLIGGFTPGMREADDEVIRKAAVFVDTESAIKESGDIVMPLRSGLLLEDEIQADLYSLCRGKHPGRRSEHEITVFKSVGSACEDLAAAILAYQAYGSINNREELTHAN